MPELQKDTENLMFCPTCESSGLTSTCKAVSSNLRVKPIQEADSYYDEDGILHIHDPNVTDLEYECSNNHTCSEGKQLKCWCGWPTA